MTANGLPARLAELAVGSFISARNPVPPWPQPLELMAELRPLEQQRLVRLEDPADVDGFGTPTVRGGCGPGAGSMWAAPFRPPGVGCGPRPRCPPDPSNSFDIIGGRLPGRSCRGAR
jgi:hypothetical protein